MQIGSLNIRDARPDEANYLTDLAMRSKAHWGYSKEFMEDCADELSVTCADIKNPNNHYMVAILEDKIIGFYSLEYITEVETELSALFVDPIYIGTGMGRSLIENAKCLAISLGSQKIIIQGDPYAEKFYRSVGGEKIGSKESGSIPGRFLPMFHIDLKKPILQNKSE